MMLKTSYIFFICILIAHRTLCQGEYKLQMYKRAVELQRSNSFSIFDQSAPSSSSQHLLNKEQFQRHKPSFSTSSAWPPELPKSFRIKKYNLPKVEYEEDKKIKKNNMKSNGVSRHSTKNQYEQSKDFHAIAQTILQDNRWERMGKIVGTAVGYGVIRAYDKCKAAIGNVQSKCSAVYDHVRRRL